MTEPGEKLPFASKEWVDTARIVLEELVAAHGESGKSFSVCEAFTDAPEGFSGPEATTAVWHFRIVDKLDWRPFQKGMSGRAKRGPELGAFGLEQLGGRKPESSPR